MEFILVSFATLIGWQILKSVVWFNISIRTSNFVVPAIAYGLTWLSHPSLLIALAATGGCALIFRFIDQDSIEPWSLPALMRRPLTHSRTPDSRRNSPDKNRIPRL